MYFWGTLILVHPVQSRSVVGIKVLDGYQTDIHRKEL